MRKIILLLLGQIILISAFSQVKVTDLQVENLSHPIGVGTAKPLLSWRLEGGKRNVSQTAYEIRLYDRKSLIWSSEKVDGSQSLAVEYGGRLLSSDTRYYWRVGIWDGNDEVSGWSAIDSFQTGLLNKEDWQAKWITPGFKEDSKRPSPLLRKEFTAKKEIASATAFITAHGMYEAQINGHRVGDAYLTPGWTSYNKRLQYQTYDVTALLNSGVNAIGVTLGNGWYRGIIGYSDHPNVYGKDVALLFQLNITYTDGTKEVFISDGSWKTSTGVIVYSEIYNGETIDERKEKKGWTLAGYDDKDWLKAKEEHFSKDNLITTENEMVKKHEVFHPVRIFTTLKGEKVIDFGQNLVGWVTMKVRGKAGDEITLSHAEVLDKDGNFYTANLRRSKAQDHYILNGEGEEVFEPHFTWHGFRYLKVEGYPGELKPEDFTAIALYSDMEPTGTFTCSNAMVNQLQHNIQWGQKGNFLDVPTDCPQRDERLGWTGDAQAFSRTATFNMNTHSFFTKWLKDVSADQKNGVMPYVIPNVLGKPRSSSAGWADAATVIPWNIYMAYGDKRALVDQYGSMKAYVESIRRVAKNDLWNSGFHFGDWLFYKPDGDHNGPPAETNKYLIAQCFYAQSTQLLINAANVLGKTEDEQTYTVLLKRIKEAFVKQYLNPDGSLMSNTQTAYVLALNFDMLPEEQRTQAAKRLVDNIKQYGNHLTTGFLGTPYLCHVLTRFGYMEVAYQLLLQDTYPSWLYPVKMGATTIWERWDGIRPDSTFQDRGMNSFNHYAYGAIGDWMYREMVGLDTYEDGVGYKHSRVQPYIGGGFTSASASLKTNYGKLSSGWQVTSDRIILDVEIPDNTNSTVYIPAKSIESISEGNLHIITLPEIKIVESKDGYVIVNLGSGSYHFSIKTD